MGADVGLFTAAELSSSFNLADAEMVKSGAIRGDRTTWMISGTVMCGKHTTINGYFNARGNIRIGKYCAIGRFVSIHSGNHRTDLPSQQVNFNRRFGFVSAFVRSRVEVGHNVWVGDKANILSGVTVGHGSVIAAGATVVSDVPPFAIVGGVPAKLIRYRFSRDVIEQSLEIRWWDWSDERIKRNAEFFETSLDEATEFDLLSIVRK
ncbi:CatB-related O-acetyltransferase [Paracoccus liaowanqingii]|nr:CatB-related O-acetyltransferase [Paracoccus liaowanqingii]